MFGLGLACGYLLVNLLGSSIVLLGVLNLPLLEDLLLLLHLIKFLSVSVSVVLVKVCHLNLLAARGRVGFLWRLYTGYWCDVSLVPSSTLRRQQALFFNFIKWPVYSISHWLATPHEHREGPKQFIPTKYLLPIVGCPNIEHAGIVFALLV